MDTTEIDPGIAQLLTDVRKQHSVSIAELESLAAAAMEQVKLAYAAAERFAVSAATAERQLELEQREVARLRQRLHELEQP